MDYAAARRWMVDGQIRPNKVTEPKLLDAFRALPRELFVPANKASLAYADDEVPLPGGRALMRPMVLARLLQLAEPKAGEQALVVCSGTGFGAALLARLGLRVVALEADAALRAVASQALAVVAPGSLRLEAGDPRQGFAAGAPYDLILIEGELTEVPAALSGQLAEGGRLVTVLGEGRGTGRAALGRNAGGRFSLSRGFDATVSPLPMFQPETGFAF